MAVAGFGELGSGSMDVVLANDFNPVPIIDPGKVVSFVSAGYASTCIVYNDWVTMKCVGSNSKAELGQGDTKTKGNKPDTTIPNITAVNLGTGSLKIKFITSGYEHRCVIFSNSLVKCFGDNRFAQLGIGSRSNIGEGTTSMGEKLPYANLFSPTIAPTYSPTLSPSRRPSKGFATTSNPTPNTANTRDFIHLCIAFIGFFAVMSLY